MIRRPVCILGLLVLLAGAVPVAAQLDDTGADATVVYLVRHAERAEDGTNDPPISADGEARARLLARILADAGIQRIHSTSYRRTRATAAPIAGQLGIDLQSYGGTDLPDLAARIRAEGGRHLVVGHSNTTPDAVVALGGDPGAPIGELEYDRLYVVTITPDRATTVLLRFGAPPPGS